MRPAVPLLVLGLVLAVACDRSWPAHDGRVEPRIRRRLADVPFEPVARPFRFAVIGDAGTGGDEQYAIARRMCRRHDRRPFGIVVTVGDNVYPSGARDRFDDRFFRPFGCLVRRGVRFRATLGNHDVLTDAGIWQIRDERFGMKGRNYTFAAGGVRFIMLDSNRLVVDYLRRRLRRHRDARWTVVAFHHPVFSPGLHGSTPGFADRLEDLFVRREVDLVLAGHDHLYAAIEPRRGVRYVVTGGAGAPLYPCSSRPFVAACRQRHHFLEVTVRADRLEVVAVPEAGPAFHSFATRGVR